MNQHVPLTLNTWVVFQHVVCLILSDSFHVETMFVLLCQNVFLHMLDHQYIPEFIKNNDIQTANAALLRNIVIGCFPQTRGQRASHVLCTRNQMSAVFNLKTSRTAGRR